MKKRLLSLLLAVLMIAGMAGSSLAAKELFKNMVHTAEVRGVQVPRAGEHPYEPRGTLTPMADAIFESQLWWDETLDRNMTSSDTFIAGQKYHFVLVLMPPEAKGEPFSPARAFISGVISSTTDMSSASG